MWRTMAGAAALALLCTGCASVTHGTTHSMRVDTETAQGQAIDGADCTLSNDLGSTVARSGSSTLVRRSSRDLEVRCTAAGQPDATARLVSRANAGMAGNILIGGLIGAAVDHSSGAAYTYPTWVKLVFGEYAVLDRRDEREGTMLAAAPGSAASTTQRATAAGAATTADAAAPAAALKTPVDPTAPPTRGQTFDYKLVDRSTQNARTVMLRVDRADENQITFNGGARVEKPNGELVSLASPMLGELDSVTPPGGWLPGGRMPRGMWPVKFSSGTAADRKSYDLTAQAGGEQVIRVQAGQFKAVRIDLDGWYRQGFANAPYRAVLWVSTELRRPIRFEAQSRTSANAGGAYFLIDETAELTGISND